MLRKGAGSPGVTGVRRRKKDIVTGKQVLLVDADGLPRRALAEQLEGLGYVVVETDSASDSLDRAGDCELMIVCDPGPGTDVRDLCRSWRDRRSAPPLALIDGPGLRADLEADGAVVLVKPVRLAELARKLQEIVPKGAPASIAIGGLWFNPATRELSGATDKSVRLTEREAAILAYLSHNADRSVPRDELLAQVLGYAGETATHTLETHIYRLRRKLAAASALAPRLRSEAKGYRLAEPEPDPALPDPAINER